jgi:hypothetical protein
MNDEKWCPGCGQIRKVTSFYARHGDRNRRYAHCTECDRRRANLTHLALRILRERHRSEYLAIRHELKGDQ